METQPVTPIMLANVHVIVHNLLLCRSTVDSVAHFGWYILHVQLSKVLPYSRDVYGVVLFRDLYFHHTYCRAFHNSHPLLAAPSQEQLRRRTLRFALDDEIAHLTFRLYNICRSVVYLYCSASALIDSLLCTFLYMLRWAYCRLVIAHNRSAVARCSIIRVQTVAGPGMPWGICQRRPFLLINCNAKHAEPWSLRSEGSSGALLIIVRMTLTTGGPYWSPS